MIRILKWKKKRKIMVATYFNLKVKNRKKFPIILECLLCVFRSFVVPEESTTG